MTQECSSSSSSSQGGLPGGPSALYLRADHSVAFRGQAGWHPIPNLGKVAGMWVAGLRAHQVVLPGACCCLDAAKRQIACMHGKASRPLAESFRCTAMPAFASQKCKGNNNAAGPMAGALTLRCKVSRHAVHERGIATMLCRGTAGLRLPGRESVLPAPGRGILQVPPGRGRHRQTAPFSS